MNDITIHNITFKQIEDGYDFGDDRFHISSLYNQAAQKAFLSSPTLVNKEQIHIYLRKVDGINAGIGFSFPTKIKSDSNIYNATSGSTLEVYEKFRKLALGADIILSPVQNKDNEFLIFAGISEMALPLYKKLRFTIFEYPRAMQLRNARCILESKGFKGKNLSICSTVLNLPIKVICWFGRLRSKIVQREFNVERVDTVPSWVTNISINDGHRFMEVHDQEWLQWNLENNLHAEERDIQSFYTIYRNKEPYGFFMTKERFRSEAGGVLHNVVIGSIMEWGSKDESILSEKTIIQLALSTFGKIDILEFATTDNSVIKSMKKYGFIQHGFAHIAIKDLKKRFKESSIIENWRIRFGYADVMLT